MTESTYTLGEVLIRDGSTKVTVQGAVTLVRNGQVVGALDAVYDFKDLAPELHHYALLVITQGTRLALPGRERPASHAAPTEPPATPAADGHRPERRGWFQRLLRRAA